MATTKGTTVADKLTGVLIKYKYFNVYLKELSHEIGSGHA
jgi:hypothetical protein